MFDWNLCVARDANPRRLANFLRQVNGAEMFRLACYLIVEREIRLLVPIHDAVMMEPAAVEIGAVVAETQAAMYDAARIALQPLTNLHFGIKRHTGMQNFHINLACILVYHKFNHRWSRTKLRPDRKI